MARSRSRFLVVGRGRVRTYPERVKQDMDEGDRSIQNCYTIQFPRMLGMCASQALGLFDIPAKKTQGLGMRTE